MRRWISVVALLLALGASPAASEDVPQLVGTVGPGFTINLADASGKHVQIVDAGRYQLLVHDLSDIHNFVLGSKSTGERLADSGVEFVGDKTFDIELKPGRYGYACSPHFEVMNGSLTVVTPTPVQRTGSLSASVGAASVSLRPRRVAPGPYRLRVVDRSRTRNFHLVGAGVDRRTGKAFRGTVTWSLRLTAGTYRFGSDPRLTGRLVVA
jgi:plastocyanin